jgi:hypothetical protein
MRTLLAMFAAVLALAASAAAQACTGPLPPVGPRVEGTVTAVTSGRSFCLATSAATVRIVLADFDACRTEATRLNLVKIVGGKRVACTVTRRTRTSALARCTVEGHGVAEVLRSAGTCERRR